MFTLKLNRMLSACWQDLGINGNRTFIDFLTLFKLPYVFNEKLSK